MGWRDVLKPFSKEVIAERIKMRRLIREIEISSLNNDISELNRLFDLVRNKVAMAKLEPRVFKLILHNYVEQFVLFQNEGVVNERNYLKYLILAAGYSPEITQLLLEYPINDPVNLFLRIKKAIQFAKRKDQQEVVDMLEQYLTDNM